MIVLEGCNGEWAQKRYLPTLTKKGAGGEIQLWAVDIADEIKLDRDNPQLEKDWTAAQNNNRAHYLNKNRDRQTYSALSNADYVFVVAPDRVHSKIVRCWLDRLAPEGKIFIEKPLDASMEAALKLKEEIKEKGEGAVFAFDHFLAIAYPFLRNKALYLGKIGKIGKIEKIEFHILEPGKIPPEREKTLDKGMIFDLFCHVLALVGAVVKQNSSYSETRFQGIKLEDVKAARYVGCPISGETFAWIELTIDSNIKVLTAVGKCVGTFEDKFMELHGANGKVKLDFVRDEFAIFDSSDKQIDTGKLLGTHVQSFLEKVLQGKEHPLLVPGILSFDAALGVLKILGKAKQQSKQQIGKMPVYQYNDSIDKILEIL